MKKYVSYLTHILFFMIAIAVALSINSRGQTDCSLVSYENICRSGPLIVSGGEYSKDREGESYTLTFTPGGEVYVLLPRSSNYEIRGAEYSPLEVNRGSLVALHSTDTEPVSITIRSAKGHLSATETYVYLGTYSQLSDFAGSDHFVLGLCITIMLTSGILFFWKKSEKYFLWLIALAFLVGRYSNLRDILTFFRLDVYAGGNTYMVINEVAVSILTFYACREFMQIKMGRIPFFVLSTAAAIPALIVRGTSEYYWYCVLFFYAVLYTTYGICIDRIPASSGMERYTFTLAWMSTASLRLVEIFCEMGVLPSGDLNLRYRIRGITSVIFVGALFICAIKRFAEKYEQSDQRNEALEKKVQEKSLQNLSFIRSMLHNLKTPLFSVSGYTDLALRTVEKDPQKARVYLEKANEKAIYAGHLMDTLSLAMRVGSGQLKTDAVPVDLSDIVRRCAETAAPEAAQKKLALTNACNSSMPMVGDPMYLQQAIQNLLDNALVNTAENGTIDLRAEKSPDGQDWVLHIRDTGCGIAREDQTKIFEAYYSKRQNGASSSGLGLYIAREIVRLHRGEISVESETGKGSDFQIRLPAAEA